MWAVIIRHDDGHLEAFGPYDDQPAASRVAVEALDVIFDERSRFSGLEDAIPVELREWPGGPGQVGAGCCAGRRLRSAAVAAKGVNP